MKQIKYKKLFDSLKNRCQIEITKIRFLYSCLIDDFSVL